MERMMNMSKYREVSANMNFVEREKAVEQFADEKKEEGRKEGHAEGRKEGRAEGKLEGKAEERQEHLIRTVCIKLRKNKPAATIADELEEELSAVERVIEAQRKAGCYDVERICAVLAE